MTDEDYSDDWDEYDGPSKSQLKRDAHALQQLGIELSKLSPEQLQKMPIHDALMDALLQEKQLKKKEAIRRHHQLIGKLMRKADHEAITQALADIKQVHDRNTRMLHNIEVWRDTLLKNEQMDLSNFLEQYPTADRQQLRQLIRNAQQEQQQNKAPASARKLFRYLRELMTEA